VDSAPDFLFILLPAWWHHNSCLYWWKTYWQRLGFCPGTPKKGANRRFIQPPVKPPYFYQKL